MDLRRAAAYGRAMAAPALEEPQSQIHGDALRRAGFVALWVAGLAAGGWLLALGLTDERGAGHRASAVLSATAGTAFVVSGLIAWRRRPDNRLGPMMVVLGFWWLAFHLMLFSYESVVFTAGIFGNDAFIALLVPFLVAFPSGRLVSRTGLLLTAPFAIAVIPLEFAWLLFLDRPVPPANALLVWPNEDVASAIDSAQRVLLASGSFLLTAVLARRWLRASPPLRRGLTPLLAGAATLLVSTGSLVVSKLTGNDPPELIQIAVLIALIGIAVGVLVDILRARLARLAVGDLVLELSRDREPEHLRAALARALGDPSLRLAYWLPEFETYADLEGRPLELPADERLVTRMVDRSGTPVAALLHDPSLRDEPALLDAVGAAAGIALENARLQAELRAAGTRVLEASQSERRRLERDLHDGAQQRLVALSLELGMLQTRLREDPDAHSAVVQARSELNRSLEELRELARGIHPAVLSGHGLEVALEGLVARAPVPVALSVDLDAPLPEPIEVAAYFLVSESLTNVAKYSQASAATVAVVRANGDVVVEIADDGVGGASAARGSGLRGLADRVEALGGHLDVTSPAGDGTRVRAEIPCG
jgi:signal transduction histidine kinase